MKKKPHSFVFEFQPAAVKAERQATVCLIALAVAVAIAIGYALKMMFPEPDETSLTPSPTPSVTPALIIRRNTDTYYRSPLATGLSESRKGTKRANHSLKS